ncbi:DNA cytosine methyltransferase [Xenorhabdus bovienii]|uniref:DNA cytosine methyltransferase n=1 Tax=Xenorhabdus bovienii TaxID=40576 RepID=UPI00056E201C
MTAYYNEIDPYAAQWLRNLIAAGHIAPGDVDERSIEDVKPDDLRNYTQCHFFAGIGVWSYALRNAGWPDDKPAWTGSCPCQPFSAAGKGSGFDDERHLWPAFFHLIEQCRPRVVFGEQVASKDGLAWFDLVQTDLEGTGYTSAAVDICAAGVGAPHIRQRLYWVADSDNKGLERRQGMPECAAECSVRSGCMDGGMAYSEREQHQERLSRPRESTRQAESGTTIKPTGFRLPHGMGISDSERCEGVDIERNRENIMSEITRSSSNSDSSPTNGYWRDADWLFCRDGKWRPVEPGSFPLAHGITNRVGRLRAYGNAIVAPVAEEFIRAYMQGV